MKIELTGLIFVIIGLVVLVAVMKNKKTTEISNSKYLKTQLLSAPEQVMFHKLNVCLPDHIVLAQVAFSQMLQAKGGTSKEDFSKYGRARQKVADFVICDKAFNIIAAIEIDDKSHKKDKDEARDQILMEAGIPTIRWKAVNLPNDEEIKQRINTIIHND